jgi:hypothetical protein
MYYSKVYLKKKMKTTKHIFILLHCYGQSLMIKLIINESLALIDGKEEHDITAWKFSLACLILQSFSR